MERGMERGVGKGEGEGERAGESESERGRERESGLNPTNDEISVCSYICLAQREN